MDQQPIYSKYLHLLATRYFYRNVEVVVDSWLNLLKYSVLFAGKNRNNL